MRLIDQNNETVPTFGKPVRSAYLQEKLEPIPEDHQASELGDGVTLDSGI